MEFALIIQIRHPGATACDVLPLHPPQALELGVKPNLLGLSLGGFIATASAGLHGEHYNKVVIVSGSAGSPESEAPSLQAQQVFSDPNATELDQLNTSFPLQFPVGAYQGWLDWGGLVCSTALHSGFTVGGKGLIPPNASSPGIRSPHPS